MPAAPDLAPVQRHQVSIVIPVYKGETTLGPLLEEIVPLTAGQSTPGGTAWEVSEVLLVFDNGPDNSAKTIRALEAAHPFVRAIWLSRNFGQHSATLAGMASSGSEWIATIDEDGQHNPSSIARLLDAALQAGAPLVYGRSTNAAPHGWLRNSASKFSKLLVSKLAGNPSTSDYQSFRLVLGEIGRSVAAYAGSGVYLDVALGWVASRATTADIELRGEGGRASGYGTRTLISHFWRLILSSGTRGLRIVSFAGVVFAGLGVILAIYFVIQSITSGNLPEGWTSLVTIVLFSSGAILFSLGVIAEYLGVAVNMAMGKPPYLVVGDPGRGPLGRRMSQ